MIISNKGIVQIDGEPSALMSDLVGAMKALLDKNIASKDDLNECLRIACMSDEEFRNELKQMVKKVFGSIDNVMNESDTFKKMFKDILEDEE